jgi:signal transduction histidine kinase
MTTPRPARWPLALSLLLVLAALATLLWLRARLMDRERETLAAAARLFETTDVLGAPESLALRFDDVESLARAVEAGDLVAEVRVAKLGIDGRERTVRPFHADLATPDWRTAPGAAWTVLPIGEPPRGRLYLRLDGANLAAVNRAIGAFALFFVVGLGVLIARAQKKEADLGRAASELEERRAEVVRLERLALAGQLSANILHDIKKPVLNIKHEVADALEGAAPPPGLLREVAAQTDLFFAMLRDLGYEDFVRGGIADEAEWCDLPTAVARSLRLVKYERRDVQVEVIEESAAPLVFAPPRRLVQLFSNLALNAFQALGGKGRLRITVSAADGAAVVLVEDDGPGIAPALRPELFRAFATTRAAEGGSGLGLYICATIAKDLGGSIEAVGSALGGAAFRVTLPGEKAG